VSVVCVCIKGNISDMFVYLGCVCVFVCDYLNASVCVFVCDYVHAFVCVCV
jgi:hypothetical protein